MRVVASFWFKSPVRAVSCSSAFTTRTTPGAGERLGGRKASATRTALPRSRSTTTMSIFVKPLFEYHEREIIRFAQEIGNIRPSD
jgi:hypothetical protein